MGKLKRTRNGCFRRCLVPLMVLALVSLIVVTFFELKMDSKAYKWPVDQNHKELVHRYVKSVLARRCRTGLTRSEIKMKFNGSGLVTDHFLHRDTPLIESMFRYPPPFGFRDMRAKLRDVLTLLPDSEAQEQHMGGCRRCVVVGNGGVLRGLELGPLIDQFDVIIRLNSGPVRGFNKDVGTRTSIRMSYPEGSPKSWEENDSQMLFVAVVYKSVDLNWLRAMITRKHVSFWDWLFFWQSVPDQIPLESSQFCILNPEVVRETAMDLLHLPTPQPRIWGWDQNVPTMGVSAITLASYLCDEVSLAGFGYNLSQKTTPLHYYDDMPMTAMLDQPMHNVARERALLNSLAKAGAIFDLTGGVHCGFCPS